MSTGSPRKPTDVTADGEESIERGFVMPFVNVTSRGGRYDDEAFTAGWEMGALDALLSDLADRCTSGLSLDLRKMIHSANAEQADLIAMHHGFQIETEDSEVEGWTHLWLTRAD